MPNLSAEQRAAIEAVAKREGVDPKELAAAAQDIVDGKDPAPDAPAGGGKEQPKLFMYLLPFVTVKEVRQRWLGLTDDFPGDRAVASEWAMEHGGSNAPTGKPDDGTSETS